MGLFNMNYKCVCSLQLCIENKAAPQAIETAQNGSNPSNCDNTNTCCEDSGTSLIENNFGCVELLSTVSSIVDTCKQQQMDLEAMREDIRNKDIEITMQKVTLQHLQDALVAAKKGLSFVPTPSKTSQSIIKQSANLENGSSSRTTAAGSHNNNNNNNSSFFSKIMDV